MTTEIQLKTGDILESGQIRSYFLGRKAAQESGEPYPINLDDVWPFAFRRKDSAVKAMRHYLAEGDDYKAILPYSRRIDGSPRSGGPSHTYLLTVKAFDRLICIRNPRIHSIYLDVFQVAMDHVQRQVTIREHRDDQNLKLAIENAALAKEVTVLQRSLLAFKDEKIRSLEAELETARSQTTTPRLPAPVKEDVPSADHLNDHWTLTNFAARFRRDLPMKADAFSKKLGLRSRELGVIRGESYSYIPHPHKPGEQLKVTTFTYPYWFLDAEIPRNHWSD